MNEPRCRCNHLFSAHNSVGRCTAAYMTSEYMRSECICQRYEERSSRGERADSTPFHPQSKD